MGDLVPLLGFLVVLGLVVIANINFWQRQRRERQQRDEGLELQRTTVALLERIAKALDARK